MTDLSELFARNPQGHSDQDIAVIVARMREAAIAHEVGAKAPAKVKAEPKPSKAIDLLKELGLK